MNKLAIALVATVFNGAMVTNGFAGELSKFACAAADDDIIRATKILNEELDKYLELAERYGGEMMPGPGKDALLSARWNIQHQMKELFNLERLTGSDLRFLDEMMVDPTSIAVNAAQLIGVNVRDRVRANIKQLRAQFQRKLEAYQKVYQELGQQPMASPQPNAPPQSGISRKTRSGITWRLLKLMPELEINGRTFEVDDSFLSMSPEQLNAEVEEIWQSVNQSPSSGGWRSAPLASVQPDPQQDPSIPRAQRADTPQVATPPRRDPVRVIRYPSSPPPRCEQASG